MLSIILRKLPSHHGEIYVMCLIVSDEAMKFMIDHILKLPSENQQPGDHITLPQIPAPTSGSMYDESFETEDPPGKNKACCG